MITRRAALAGVLAGLPSAAAAEESDPHCYDAAVVAQIAGYKMLPWPEPGPNEIVLSGPVRLQLDVEQVVFGRLHEGPLTITMILHTRFNSAIEHILFLLRRRSKGWAVENIEVDVVADRRGRFVIPIAKPWEREDLAPNGWLPQDYEQWLRPIQYDPRAAWWLAERDLQPEELKAPADDWSRPQAHGRVAVRGLLIDDLPKWLPRCG